MGRRQPPLAEQVSPKAMQEGEVEMQAWLSRRSGRERSREDGRAAFENLLGFYATVTEWKARADREDREALPSDAAPVAAPRTYRPKRGSPGRKAANTE